MGNARLVPIPIPTRGLNTVDPAAPLDSRYARELTNYSLSYGKLIPRPAYVSSVFNVTLSGFGGVEWYDGDEVILSDGKIRTLSTGAGATTIGGTPLYQATTVKHSSLELVFGLREPRIAASPFTAWTFTTVTITATDIRAGCTHKSRLYVADANTIEYSAVDAITGAMAGSFSLASQLGGQSIVRIFSLAISPSDQTSTVLIIFADGGKVIVYGGDYPGSATWALLCKFDMPSILNNTAFLEHDGDIWVGSSRYPYWARDLFSGGSKPAKANSPVGPVQNFWQKCCTRSTCFYEPSTDAIVCVGGFSESASLANITTNCLVYFLAYDAWAMWTFPPLQGPFKYLGGLLYGCSSNAESVLLIPGRVFDYWRSFSSTFSPAIETSWKTPYISPFEGRAQKVNGVRVFFQNDQSGYFHKVRTIFDFSDYNAPLGWYSQSTVTPTPITPGVYYDASADDPELDSEHYRPMLAGGGVGGGFSIQATIQPEAGSATDQELSIYAVNVMVEDGGPMF